MKRTLSLFLVGLVMFAGESRSNPLELEAYFEAETRKLEERCLAEIQTADDWRKHQDAFRAQLQDMLGLAPWPERSDLQATVTGQVEHEEFVVEKLHFQSLPGLYVTANLYRPKTMEAPLPAILYVCGHGRVVEDGVSLGNKARYQHHPAWFARNGYVCLIIDTIQLGEIEGLHHGTYREGMWWWNSRGYTSAGVEAWNGIRALDYLCSRPEVDPERIGMTGRSGGGIYTWWVGALDERVKVAVPVAGITSLRNHVVDGCVEGHCDCMYQINTYRWDYPQVAALMVPRPLLISNSDKDRIFPLEGVLDVHRKVRRIYRLLDAEDRLGLQITEGPHQDTQELRVHAFRWFNRFLKGDEGLIRQPAEALLPPSALRVFDVLPEGERTSTIHESFVPMALPSEVPADRAAWMRKKDAWREGLKTKVFGGWPEEGEKTLLPRLVRLEPAGNGAAGYRVELEPLETWAREPRKAHHLRRRFMLLGQTLDGMRVWDLVRQLNALEEPVVLGAAEESAGIALFASLFTERIARLDLARMPVGLEKGSIFLNFRKTLGLPEVLAMAAERCPVSVINPDGDSKHLRHPFVEGVMELLGFERSRFMVIRVGVGPLDVNSREFKELKWRSP